MMDKKTKRALEGSIRKWQKIVDYLHNKRKIDFNKIDRLERGGGNCPLCLLNVGCKNCPVTNATHRKCCQGTPYVDFHDAYNCFKDIKAMKKSAKKEVTFLKSLRG